MTAAEIDRRTLLIGASAAFLAGASAAGAAHDLALVYDRTCFKVGVPTDGSAFSDQTLYPGGRAVFANAAEAAAQFRDRRIVMALLPALEAENLLAEPDLALARV